MGLPDLHNDEQSPMGPNPLSSPLSTPEIFFNFMAKKKAGKPIKKGRSKAAEVENEESDPVQLFPSAFPAPLETSMPRISVPINSPRAPSPAMDDFHFETISPPSDVASRAPSRAASPTRSRVSSGGELEISLRDSSPTLPVLQPSRGPRPRFPSRKFQINPTARSWSPPPTRGDGVILSMPSGGTTLAGYASKRSELLDILKELHSTGIQNELDLPQIVVIGSQSVGKSSLIESMSGLSLPRESGTCTRCPMECRLQQAEVWSCKIVLRFQHDSRGKPLDIMREVPFGEVLFDKRDVEKMLRRAQRAILRPGLDPQLFLDDSDLEKDGYPPQTFSKNCVCVRVAGPNVPDLYFYDLPGLIANVSDGGNEDDITLVEDLAKEYISRPNCIVLLVISCETDFENQGAGRLVLKNEGLRQRTIGVLTKVDRIEFGASAKWLKILRNNQPTLRKGWFCVKQPDPLQLEAGITWEDAKADEQRFFDETSPWSDLEERERQRLGSAGLAECLGGTLSDLVARELPNVQAKITLQLAQINSKLRGLPIPNIRDPRTEVVMLLRGFTNALSKHIDGLPPTVSATSKSNTTTSGLLNAINDASDRFSAKVLKTAPQFRPWSSQATIDAALGQELIKSIQEDDDAFGAGTINKMYLDQVSDLAKRSRTRELPGNYPFSLKANLVLESTQHWRSLAQNCFKETNNIVLAHIELLVEAHFGKYAHGGLRDEILRIVHLNIAKRATAAVQKIEDLCKSEDSPYTQNEHYFFDYRSKLLRRYQLVHRQSKGQAGIVSTLKTYNPSTRPDDNPHYSAWGHINTIISNLNSLGISGVVAKDLARLLPDADLDPALEIMAEVRAYFQVAYKRFIDNIPNEIDAAFIRNIDDDMDLALRCLDLSTANCLKWLQEPSSITKLRKELLGKQSRLEAAREKLMKYYEEEEEPEHRHPSDFESVPDHPSRSSPLSLGSPSSLESIEYE